MKTTIHIAAGCALLLAVLMIPATPVAAADPAAYVMSDVRVLYLADDAASIDWPTIYYLNNEYGCRIDIVWLQAREQYRATRMAHPDKGLYFHYFYLPPGEERYLDSVAADLFADRHPDIALLSAPTGEALYAAFRNRILAMEPSSTRRFNILKIYQQADKRTPALDSTGAVVLNGREMAARCADRMRSEIPLLLNTGYRWNESHSPLVRYDLLKNQIADAPPGIDFLTGIPHNRLVNTIDDLLPRGPKKLTLIRQAREFQSSLQAAGRFADRERVEALVRGYRALYDLVTATDNDPLFDSQTDLRFYTGDLLARTERLALAEAGVRWDGRVILRDSPHGSRLKFRAALSADGPRQVELRTVQFRPYWDSVAVVLDSTTRVITPHQSFIREYLVDIDRGRLSAQQPESLVFTADIAYGSLPMTVRNTLAVWQADDLSVRFEPDFYFVPPVANLDIDRVVSPMNLRVLVSKPLDFEGTVQLNLQTPRGLFAGAYQQEMTLERGKTAETVRIPFSISKLFELGLQRQTISIVRDGQILSADTAVVRIASCRIDDKTTVAFLPDTTGLLEDILNMTEAAFRPLTDRGLVTANLDAYDVIVVGSGAFRQYPSFRDMKDRLETFLRHGGSLVLLGQPEDWPEGVLPVSFVPGIELVDGTEITNRIPQANVLSRPYKIVEANLMSSFFKRRDVAAAAMAPTERVLVTPSNASLLAISRIGDGQIIYCGLPLLEMIARLDIDAIHLFANILNY